MVIGDVELQRVVLDTTACIYYLEGSPGHGREPVLRELIRAAIAGELSVLIPTVVALELLTLPLRQRNRIAEVAARRFLEGTPGISPVDLSMSIAGTAAALRARHGLRTPDAAILATGIVQRADAVIGNDGSWKRVSEVRYLHLDDLPPI